MSYSPEAEFDEQGQFFWATCKIGKLSRESVEKIMITKFHKTHWNILDEKEKKQMIAIAKKYAAKEKKSRKVVHKEDKGGKGLRQAIMATWKACGHEVEELHDLMKNWGFGESLRACTKDCLYTILDRVKKICQPVKGKSKRR